MDGDEIITATVVTTLNAMFRKGMVDIVTIRDCANLMDVTYECKAFDVLESLHCTYFKDMPATLANQIPALVNEILFDNPVPQFRVQLVAPLEIEVTARGARQKKLPWYRR